MRRKPTSGRLSLTKTEIEDAKEDLTKRKCGGKTKRQFQMMRQSKTGKTQKKSVMTKEGAKEDQNEEEGNEEEGNAVILRADDVTGHATLKNGLFLSLSRQALTDDFCFPSSQCCSGPPGVTVRSSRQRPLKRVLPNETSVPESFPGTCLTFQRRLKAAEGVSQTMTSLKVAEERAVRCGAAY